MVFAFYVFINANGFHKLVYFHFVRWTSLTKNELYLQTFQKYLSTQIHNSRSKELLDKLSFQTYLWFVGAVHVLQIKLI